MSGEAEEERPEEEGSAEERVEESSGDEEEVVPETTSFDKLKLKGAHFINNLKNEQECIRRTLSDFSKLLDKFTGGEMPDEEKEYMSILTKRFVFALLARDNRFFENDYEMADRIVNVMKKLIHIAVPMIATDEDLGLEILYHTLNADLRFFREFGHDWREKRGVQLTKEEMDCDEWRKFIANVGAESWIDYLHRSRWKTGVVLAKVRGTLRDGRAVAVLRIQPRGTPFRSQTDGEFDEIPFEEEFYNIAAPGGYKFASGKHRPFLSDWRRDLAVGSKADSLDKVRKWYSINVTAVSAEMNSLNVNYDGWSARYDEWFERDDVRLQPHLSQAKGGKDEGGVSGTKYDVEHILDDDTDPEDADIFAVDRGSIGNISFHIVDLINEFGRLGGFKKVIERLNKHEPNTPVRHLRYLIAALSKCTRCMTKRAYELYVPSIQAGVWDTLKQLTDVELRELKKEWLSKIVACVEQMLRRSKTSEETAEMVERFQLEMALRRINSASIERRLNGVQYIGTICSSARTHTYRQITLNFITPKFLQEWIKANDLMGYLFGPKSHPQIMKKATEILKFLCAENFLDTEHLQIVWEAIARAAAKDDDVDGELKTLTKIIDDVSFYLKPSHFDFLFQQFEAVELKTLTSEHLTLMKELARHNARGEGDTDEEEMVPPAQRALKILWNLIQDASGASLAIVDEAKNLIRDTLNTYYTRDLRAAVMDQCVANIESHKSVVVSLQLLQLVLQLYPQISTSVSDDGDRWTIVANLANDKKMIDFIFADIAHFKEAATAKAKKIIRTPAETKTGGGGDDDLDAASDEAVNAMTLAGAHSFEAEVSCRFEFLDYALEQSKNQILLTKEQMTIVWQCMVVDSLTGSEKDAAMAWVAKVAVATPPHLEADVPQFLFEEGVLKNFEPRETTLPGFDCFFAFFVSVNNAAGNLKVSSGTSFFVDKYESLIGVDSVWSMVLHARNHEVNQKAIDLLNQLCTRLVPDKRESLADIRSAMLSRTMEELEKATSRLKGSDSDEERAAAQSNVMRVVRLIHHFLNATESRGVGGLKPHNALSRGKTWRLNIIDKVNYSGYGRPPHLKVTVRENDSLWVLRSAIGTRLKTYPELIILSNPREMKEDLNSQTISSIGIRDGQTIHAEKVDQTSMRLPLVYGSPPEMAEACKNALKGIFKVFAKNEDGTMSFENMRDYIIACGAGEHSATQTRILTIFKTYGDFTDKLVPEGFCNFYKQACIDRPHHVWNDLSVYGYRYDLRRHEDARKEEEELLKSKPESLPRFILSSDTRYFDLINECLSLKAGGDESDELSLTEVAWKLLLRLPTNPALRQRIIGLEDVESAADWSKLLPADNIFKLTYSLLICESLTVEPESGENMESLEERANWRSEFLSKGGFQHLVQLLKDLKLESDGGSETTAGSRDEDVRGKTQQLAVASILKVVNSFFVGAIACIPSMDAVVKQIQELTLSVADEVSDDSKADAKKSKKDADKGSKKVDFESGEWSDVADFAGDYGSYMQLSDDDDSDENNGAMLEETMASQLEKLYEEQIEKASGIPAEVLAEMKSSSTAAKKSAASKAVGAGTQGFIGPQQPGASTEGPPGFDEKTEMEEKGYAELESGDDRIEDAKEGGLKDAIENVGEDEVITSPPGILKRASSLQQFQELVIATTKEHSARLLESLNYKELLMHLLSILKFASGSKQVSMERDLVVRYAVRMWVSLLLFRPELLPDLFETLRMDPSFILTALQSTDREIGTEFAKSIKKLCRHVDSSPNYTDELAATLPGIEIVSFFLRDILLKHLPKGSSDEMDPEQHFNLLIALLQEYTDKYHGSVKDFTELFAYLVDELIKYRSKEAYGEPYYDKVMTGLMTLLCVLIAHEKQFRIDAAAKGLIDEVFTNFLFATGKTVEEKAENLPKCKVFSSRRLAFRLLVLLCVDVPENFGILRPLIDGVQLSVKPPNTVFEYSPDRDTRSHSGFVGLRNMGSTCYMNSLLQQFYMIPQFRNCIMASGKLLEERLTDEEKKESLLFQAMETFAFLTLSEKQAFNTREFCYSYKDEFGNPIDTRIQQDAQEFFNIFTDRIENQLKDTEYRHLMQDCFGGKVVNQMICQGGCGTVRERQQQFLMVSLPIKSRTTMEQSLDAYVSAEMLEGVSCDTCGRKCDTKKREVLAHLPNTIFFQLKRFELNFETFRQEKINQRLEFPTEIDLEPFTKEGLSRIEKEKEAEKDSTVEVPEPYSVHPPEYYNYQLVGVVIHSGSADAGHYYSFIKDRKTGVWNEFNDSMVKPFNIEHLERDCFGGARKEKSYYGWTSGWDSHDKINNGYILVYDRKEFTTPLHESEEEESKDGSQDVGSADGTLAAGTGESDDKKAADEAKSTDESTSALPDSSMMSLADATLASASPMAKTPTSTSEEAPATDGAADEGLDADVEAEEAMAKKKAAEETAAKEPAPVNVLTYIEKEPRDIIASYIYDKILNDNIEFARERQVFNVHYFKFVFDALRVVHPTKCLEYSSYTSLEELEAKAKAVEEDADGGTETGTEAETKKKKMSAAESASLANIQLATHVCFRYLGRTSDKASLFAKFAAYLRWLYSTNIAACCWFLDYLTTGARTYNLVPDFILKTRDLNVMKEFGKLIAHCILQLKAFEAQHLDECIMKRTTFKTQTGEERELEYQWGVTYSARMLQVLLQLLDSAAKYWYRFQSYFQVFLDVSEMGDLYRAHMVHKQYIARLGDFYMGKQGPYAPTHPHKVYTPMGTRAYPAKFAPVIGTICNLLVSCQSPATRNRLKRLAAATDMSDEEKEALLRLPPTSTLFSLADGSTGLLPLSETDEKLPHSRGFYTLLIRDAHNSANVLNSLCDVVCHWAFEDANYSDEVVKIISNGVDKSGADTVHTFINIMERFLAIDDSQKERRLTRLHARDYGVLYLMGVYRKQHQPFCYRTMACVVEAMQKNADYASFMAGRRSQWKWWDAWLDAYCHRKSYYGYQQTADADTAKLLFWDQYAEMVRSLGLTLERLPPPTAVPTSMVAATEAAEGYRSDEEAKTIS